MVDVMIIVTTLSILLSVIALVIALLALAGVIGLKNSTHQVVWKTHEPVGGTSYSNTDEEEEDFTFNPNKRQKVEKADEFADLTDPAVTSAF